MNKFLQVMLSIMLLIIGITAMLENKKETPSVDTTVTCIVILISAIFIIQAIYDNKPPTKPTEQ